MKKFLPIVLILLFTLVLTLAGCSNELPPNQVPEKDVTLFEAVNKTQTVLSDGLLSVGEAKVYNIGFDFELKAGEKTIALAVNANVNEDDNSVTELSAVGDDVKIYYVGEVCYVDYFGSKKKVEGFDLALMVSTIKVRFAQVQYPAIITSFLTSVKETKTNGYVFNASSGVVVNRLLSYLTSQVGSSTLVDIFPIEGITSEQLASSQNQTFEINYSDNGFTSFEFSSTVEGKDFSVKVSSPTVSTGIIQLSLPSSFDGYEPYSFNTVVLEGQLSVKKNEKTLLSTSANEATVKRAATSVNYPFSARMSFSPRGFILQKALVSVTVPTSVASGYVDPTVDIYMDFAEEKIYFDATEFGVEQKFVFGFDQENIVKITDLSGKKVDFSKVFSAAALAMQAGEEEGFHIEFSSLALGELLSAIGYKDVFGLEKIVVDISVSGNDLSLFKLGFVCGDATYTVQGEDVKIGFSSLDFGVLDKTSYVDFDTVDSLVIAQRGKVVMPENADGDLMVQGVIKELFGFDFVTDVYNGEFSYELVSAFDLETPSSSVFSLVITGTGNADSYMIVFDMKTDEATLLKSNASGVYEKVAVLDLSNASNAYSRIWNTVKRDVFGDGETITDYLLEDRRTVNAAFFDIMGTALTASKSIHGYNSALTEILLSKTASSTCVFKFANNQKLTISKTGQSVKVGKLSAISESILTQPFELYGQGAIPSFRIAFGTGEVPMTAYYEVRMENGTVEFDENSLSSGTIVFDLGGVDCRVRAENITLSDITKKELMVGGRGLEVIEISASSLNPQNASAAISVFNQANTVKLYFGQNVTQIVNIQWLDDISEVLATLSGNTTSNLVELGYTYTDKIGNVHNETIQLVLKDVYSDISSVSASVQRASNPVTFYSYGNVDPRKVDSYPEYFDLRANKFVSAKDIEDGVEAFNGSSYLALDWDITSVKKLYNSDWQASQGTLNGDVYEDTSVVISAKALGVWGYETDIEGVVVTIVKDEFSPDNISFDLENNVYPYGLGYMASENVLIVDPLVLSSLKIEHLIDIRYASVKVKGSDTERVFSVIWDFYVEDDEVGINIYKGQDSVVDIDNKGLDGAYVYYRIGDNIGGVQTVKLPVKVLRKEMTKWSLSPTIDGRDTVSGIDPVRFTAMLDEALENGIAAFTVVTDHFNIKYDGDYEIKFDLGDKHYVVVIDTNAQWSLREEGAAWALAAGTEIATYSVSDLFESTMSELYHIYTQIHDWNATASQRFSFGEGELEKLSYGTNSYKSGTLDYVADFGTQQLKLKVEFDENSLSPQTLSPVFADEYKDAVSFNYNSSTGYLEMIIDAYGNWNFFDIDTYPTKLSSGLSLYDISWNIDNLKDITGNVYEGSSDKRVYFAVVRGQNDGKVYSDTFEVIVTVPAIEINPNKAYYRLFNDDTEYNPDKYGNEGIINWSIATLNGSYLTIKNPTDVSLYSKYVGITLEGVGSSRWLPVNSWDISEVTAYFADKSLNESSTLGQTFYVYASVGTEWGGYQTVVFSMNLDDSVSSTLSVKEFTALPQMLNESGVPINASQSIDYSGDVPVITFNPYLVDISDARRYPAKVVLKSNEGETGEYDVENWDLSGITDTSYRGGVYEAYITVALNLRFKVTVKSLEMRVAAMTGRETYSIDFNPLSESISPLDPTAPYKTLGNNLSTVDVYKGVVTYSTDDPDFKFMFLGSEAVGIVMKLNVRFNTDKLPTSSNDSGNITGVSVGNSIGGYQEMPLDVDLVLKTESGDYTSLLLKSIAYEDTNVCTLSEIQAVAFNTLPEVETLKASFYGFDGSFDMTHGKGNGGLFFTYSDKSGNEVESLPYALNVYTYLSLFDVSYSIIDGITVEVDIKDWFTNMKGENTISFEWDRSYSVGNVKAAVLTKLDQVLAGKDLSIKEFLAGYSDLLDKDGFTKEIYDDMSVSVENISTPGAYKLRYTVNDTDPKYKGYTEFSFTVDKKDLYKAGSLDFFFNGISLGNEGTIPVVYTGSAIDLALDFAEGKASEYEGDKVRLDLCFSTDGDIWTTEKPVDVGTYFMKARIANSETSEDHALYTSSIQYTVKISALNVTADNMQIVLSEANDRFTSNKKLLPSIVVNGNKRLYYDDGYYDICLASNEQPVSVNELNSGETYELILVLKGNYSGKSNVFTVDIP